MMGALALSEAYFQQTAGPALKKDLPDIWQVAAAGLVGNGSECFGFDDELSRDHDWGVDFFLWLPDSQKSQIPLISQWKQKLFTEAPPSYPRTRSAYGAQINVMTCGQFYNQLTGSPDGIMDALKWLRAPEGNLAMAVNGKVFLDHSGDFTAIRNRLLAHYPEDVRKKKIAAKCMAIAQTGQYNLKRTMKRGDWVTANTVLTMFVQQVIALVFLLNQVYKPYYKWEYRMMCGLPILGEEVGLLLSRLNGQERLARHELEAVPDELINEICRLLHGELLRQELSQCRDPFFAAQGESVQRSIKDETLRSLPPQFE